MTGDSIGVKDWVMCSVVIFLHQGRRLKGTKRPANNYTLRRNVFNYFIFTYHFIYLYLFSYPPIYLFIHLFSCVEAMPVFLDRGALCSLFLFHFAPKSFIRIHRISFSRPPYLHRTFISNCKRRMPTLPSLPFIRNTRKSWYYIRTTLAAFNIFKKQIFVFDSLAPFLAYTRKVESRCCRLPCLSL